MLKPIILEVCDHGRWSLELRVGEGDGARDTMRQTSEFLRQIFDNVDLNTMRMIGNAYADYLEEGGG